MFGECLVVVGFGDLDDVSKCNVGSDVCSIGLDFNKRLLNEG